MRLHAAVLALLTLTLQACATTGMGPNGWAGGVHEPRARASAPRRAPARVPSPRPPTAARPLPAARPSAAPAPSASGLIVPVDGVGTGELRDSFTSARSGGRTHHAIDIGAPLGTPVLAVTDGTVSRMTWNRLGGRTLYLAGADGRHEFYYAHLDSYADGLEVGRRVRRGDALGTVGQTGNARSPHLHFQVLDRTGGGRGTPVNPYELLRRAETIATARSGATAGS